MTSHHAASDIDYRDELGGYESCYYCEAREPAGDDPEGRPWCGPCEEMETRARLAEQRENEQVEREWAADMRLDERRDERRGV